MTRWLDNWLARHQHPVSRGLHLVAIPLLPVAAYLATVQVLEGAWNIWWRPAGLLVISYAMQWVAHRIEGNEMGEVILLKRLLGRPYVAISPRFGRRPGQGTADKKAPTTI